MMKKFNQEQVDNLRQYEDIFFKAVNQNYYRSMNTKTLEAMVSIYNETTDTPYKGNWACSHCVLAFLKLIGSKYYEDKKLIEEKAEKLIEVLDEVFGEVPDEEVQKEPEPKSAKKSPARKSNKKATNK